MSKHETFTALMNAGMAWGAIIGGLYFVVPRESTILVIGLTTLAFWVAVSGYFYWDYEKTHKSPNSTLNNLNPRITGVVEQLLESEQPKKLKHSKWTFIKNTFFIVLGVSEAAFCLSMIMFWQEVTIPFGQTNVPVVTYQNGLLLVLFAVGLIVAIDMAKRLRHPREAFFEE